MKVLLQKLTIKSAPYLVAVLSLLFMQATDFLSELHEKFTRYADKNPSVKLNLTFHQPSYAVGDTAYFTAWYLDDSFRGVKGDHIVTLDIIGGNQKTFQRTRFKVQNGRGFNQFRIDPELPPGDYKMVAYTSWMKNFGPSWMFQKDMQITYRSQVTTKRDNGATFYPEGGNLVAGIQNNVGVVGMPRSEWIISGSQAEVQKVVLDSTGVASFFFIPQRGQVYKAQSVALNKVVSLPSVQEQGIAVKASEDAHVWQLSAPIDSKWVGEKVYAVALSKGKIISENEVMLSKETGMAELKIPNAEGGLNQLFIFDSKGNVLAQRIFALPLQTGIEANLQFAAVARQRETVNGTLTISDKLRNQPISDFSVTVVQKNLFKERNAFVDPNYWDLPALTSYISKHGTPDPQRLNIFLISQKWERINWANVLADKQPTLAFPFQGQTRITGEVVSKVNGSAPPDSTVILTYLQKNTIGYEAEVVDGKFKVPFIFDFYGNDQVFCTLQSRARVLDGDYKIVIKDDSVQLAEVWESIETEQPSPYGDYSFKQKLVASSYSFFGKKEAAAAGNESPNRFFEDEFFGVDYTVNVQDYLIFPKMEELLREIVPFVQHRRRGQTETVRMLFRFETSTKLAKSDPLYIIDGIMSRNTPYFLSLKPENVLYIKVLNDPNKLQQLGKLGENGIVFVESKRGVSSGSYERNVFDVVGLSRPLPFPYNEQFHFNANGRVPDLRSAFYWNPSFKSDRTGRAGITFSASDDVGPALIRVEGFTEDGRPFFAETVITIGFEATAKN